MSDATDSDWAALGAENGLPANVTRDALLTILWAQHREAKQWRKEHDQLHNTMHVENTARLDSIVGMLRTNNEMTMKTAEMVETYAEVKAAGRVMTRVVRWVGYVAAAVASVWGLWTVASGGGSGGIGPTP